MSIRIHPQPAAWRGRSRSFMTLVPVLAAASLLLAFSASSAHAIGFDNNDFIVPGFNSNELAVYDSDLTYKGNLDASFVNVAGVDFDAAGNVVAVSQDYRQNAAAVRTYSAAGTPLGSFESTSLSDALDIKVTPTGNYIVGTQDSQFTAAEFTPAGAFVRSLGTDVYSGIAVLPGNVLWAGAIEAGAKVDVFSLATGNLTGTINLDNGQHSVTSMTFSAATGSVLTVDSINGRIYERNLDGSFVRRFDLPAGAPQAVSVTRGPGGDVYATSFNNDSGAVQHWLANGTFVGTTVLTDIVGPTNILWTGNAVPEPASLSLFALGGGAMLIKRRRHA